jgi:hypothetical protein
LVAYRREARHNAVAQKALESESAALRQSQASELRARLAEGDAKRQLYRSLTSTAKSLRLSGQPGWRTQALSALQNASRLDVPERDRSALRGEAAACLARIDVRTVAKTWVGARIMSVDFHPSGRRLATARINGLAEEWSLDNNELHLVSQRSDPDFNRKQFTLEAPLPTIAYSADGHSLLHSTYDHSVKLWEPQAEGRQSALQTGDSPPDQATRSLRKWAHPGW